MIKAHQIRKDTLQQSSEAPINFAMEIMPPIPSPHKDSVSLIPVDFTVLAINGVPVKVNTISLKLIQPPHGGLVIVHAEEIPFAKTAGADTCEVTQSWSLCRIRAIVIARLKSMMEATKNKTNQVQGWVKEKTGCGKGEGRRGFWRHPHPPQTDGEHSHRHHGHHGHHIQPQVGDMLQSTMRFFIVPALLGIIGGLAASAIGMLAGQAIVLIWMKAYRSNQRGPLRVIQQEVVVEADEKDGLLQEDESLPIYEDAPRYEDAMSRDIEADALPSDDEKH